jgi:hypothetical protein
MDDIQLMLTDAVNGVYKDLVVESYNFNLEEESYDIELYHKTTNKKISIGFRDTKKRRDFDIIPLHAMNAPLSLIELFTAFLKVYWHAQEHQQTMQESLIELVDKELSEFQTEEEKLVQ